MSKKPIKKNNTKKPQKNLQKTFLFVQVFQTGILQLEDKFELKSFFTKKITIGSLPSCNLHLPHEKKSFDITLFKINKYNAEILCDPRIDGYINTSQKFGEIREFTAPRDALGFLTSIDDPLPIEIQKGARGRLRLFGFEIVFKIGIPIKEKKFKNLPIPSRNFLQFPPYDTVLERAILPICIIATLCIFIPILHWLYQYPSKLESGILSLPNVIINQFIAPENIRLLPYAFGESYIPDKTPQLALLWVKELQNRWEHFDQNQEYKSSIPLLEKTKNHFSKNNDLVNFQKKIKENYVQVEKDRATLGESERYFNYLKPSAIFASIVSGAHGKSNQQIIDKRLNQLKMIDNAILEYLNLEHSILKNYYLENFGAKKLGLVIPPKTGQLLGRQPDPLFTKEYTNYKIAEMYAQISLNSKFRSYLKLLLNKDLNTQYSSVTLSDSGLILPIEGNQDDNLIDTPEQYSTFLSNAVFSDLFILPPLPKPKPIIDLKMVQFVVYNKKEELRSCYNSALRKNPHLSGNLILSWSINDKGKASQIQLSNGPQFPAHLKICLQSRIQSWKFPKSKNGPSIVSFPFQFIHGKKE